MYLCNRIISHHLACKAIYIFGEWTAVFVESTYHTGDPTAGEPSHIKGFQWGTQH